MTPLRPPTQPSVPPRAHFEATPGPRYVVRTMQRDIADALEKDKPSLGTVVLAEEQRRRERSVAGEGSELSRIEPPRASRRFNTVWLAVVGGSILFFGALVAVGFVLLEQADPERAPQTPLSNSLLPIDGSVSPVTLSGLTTLGIRTRLREAVEKAKTPINTVYAIPLVDRGQLLPEEKGAILVELTTDEFFRRSAPDVPAALRRALDPAFVFGVHAFKGDSAFLVFGVQSFEIAFAEMLAWERTIPLDIGPIFKRGGRIPAPVESTTPPSVVEGGDLGTTTFFSTGTSTGETALPRRTLRSGAERFEDEVIKSYDARVLRSEGGEPIILYAFPNRSNLIIAGSIATLEELIRRLTTEKR